MYFGSHSAIPPFRLERPATLAAALRARAGAGRHGAFMAGGLDLIPALRAGRARVQTLIALGGISELGEIRGTKRSLRIGALVTYRQLESDPRIRAALPELAEIWGTVGNIRMRYAATVGGNLMAGNPNYDLLPALLALDASALVAERRGAAVALRAHELGQPIAPGTLLCAIEIPLRPARRFAMDRSMKPMVNLALALERQGKKSVIRAAYGCIGGVHMARVEAASRAGAAALAKELVAAVPAPIGDAHSSASYRSKLMMALTRRILVNLGLSA